MAALIVGMLASCATRVPLPPPQPSPLPSSAPTPVPGTLAQAKSRWVPVDWSELPGLDDDSLHEAWSAWLRSCERPAPAFTRLCPQVRQLSIASESEQQTWLRQHLQPYRIETPTGQPDGLLTSYYEPILQATRTPGNGFNTPLYRVPADLQQRQPWYSRQEIDSLPQAQAALAGRAIAWVRDPVEAMVLHIQGSGRLHMQELDGSRRMLRLAYAGTNGQPYRSIGRWLLDQGLIRDATWPGINAWVRANPQRLQELLWTNPRYVFFKEEALTELDASFGPRGAQGVALTPGRSIAVDKDSIPYGTPVWLASSGPTAQLNRLVLAQDTGSAIVGAVRADYFAGWGEQAGDFAGKLKQNLRLWALWPKP